jgi:hypothetical protein
MLRGQRPEAERPARRGQEGIGCGDRAHDEQSRPGAGGEAHHRPLGNLARRERSQRRGHARCRDARKPRGEHQVTGIERGRHRRRPARNIGRRVIKERHAGEDGVEVRGEAGEHQRESQPSDRPPRDAARWRGIRGREREQQAGLREIQPVEEDAHRVPGERAIARQRVELQEAGARERGRGTPQHAQDERRQRGGEGHLQQPLVGKGERGEAFGQCMAAHDPALRSVTTILPCMRSCARPQYTVQ